MCSKKYVPVGEGWGGHLTVYRVRYSVQGLEFIPNRPSQQPLNKPDRTRFIHLHKLNDLNFLLRCTWRVTGISQNK